MTVSLEDVPIIELSINIINLPECSGTRNIYAGNIYAEHLRIISKLSKSTRREHPAIKVRTERVCPSIFHARSEPYMRTGGCVVHVSARGSEGRRFDTRVHQLSD